MGEDLNTQILQPVAVWILTHHGQDELQRIAKTASIDIEKFDGGTHWIALEQFETVLSELYALLAADEVAFKAACVFRYREDTRRLFRMVFQAHSPRMVFERSCPNMHLVSHISTCECLAQSDTRVTLKYRTSKPESRLMCLSRQAQVASLTTLWNLPPAHLSERTCVARGDSCCEYNLVIYSHARWTALLGGSVGGVSLALLFSRLFGAEEQWQLFLWIGLPVIGGLAGYARDLRRRLTANLGTSGEIVKELESLAIEEAEARREIKQLQERESEWSRVIEEHLGERLHSLHEVAARIEAARYERVVVLNEFSRSIRGSMSRLSNAMGELRALSDKLDPKTKQLVADVGVASGEMDHVLVDLLNVATVASPVLRFDLQVVETVNFGEAIRRRLRALLRDRDQVRISVFSTREAPAEIVTDPFILDRIVDALIGYAADKISEGSILVEITGVPNFLVFKISDTGHGCASEFVERVFTPQDREELQDSSGPYELGLSVVVWLLSEIGGRLEVKSFPGRGTTYWAYVAT